MTDLAQTILNLLKQNAATLATAESCTGGAIAASITALSGASEAFDRGFITYSNAAKTEMLGVSPETLETHGAVSAQTATEMAEGALKNSAADITISVTGIAGPSGGTPEKPVGLVYFGLAQTDKPTQSFEHHFNGDRHSIQTQAAQAALNHLKDALS